MDAVVDHDATAPQHPVNHPAAAFAKGKRTKRQRPHSPIPFAISPLPLPLDYLRLSPPSETTTTTTEEVETAKCLLLLSQGSFSLKPVDSAASPPPLPKRATAAAGGAGVYTCKTCNRTFSSFQALGGHRTSHRKVKADRKSAMAFSDDEDFLLSAMTRFPPNSLSLHLSTIPVAAVAATKSFPSPRMHECSYCGAEFTSGQALGGHMRKHRPGPVGSRSPNIPIEELDHEESKRHKSGLPLDLNLPAPEDENYKFGLRKGPQEKYKAEKGLGLQLTPLLTDMV